MTDTLETVTADGTPAEVRAELDAWLEQNWDPELTVAEWWQRLAAGRWASPAMPVEAGGRGYGRALAAAVSTGLAEADVVGPPTGLGLMLAAPTIAVHGTPDQVDRYVPEILDGSVAWCQLFSEPGAGSDLAGLTTRAELDGGEWVVTGQKVWTSGAEDSDLGMDDYVRLGVLDALDTIRQIVPGQKVQALGYCLGGTLLSLSAAAMARDGRDDLASMTLLAAQVDFTEAGEITLFINDSQVAFLEDMMHQQGYLKANQMAGAFEMLRTNDLIWARMIREYLLGDRLPMNDLMAWNADSTRMPARMHSEYLRHLFLENQLALGQFEVGGRPVSLSDIAVPIFAVGTETDHVAPWRSAWKIGHLADAPVTFLLTNGGHNAGIISEPGHPHRHYRVGAVSGHVQRADDWFAAHDPKDGSWWPVWADWLLRQSSGTRPAKAKPPRSLGAAPGTYVFG